MERSIGGVAADLRKEARWTNERRGLVIHGSRSACESAVAAALDGAGFDPSEVHLVGETDQRWATDRVEPKLAGQLLGETLEAVVVDAHGTCRPNVLGQVSGAVDGGGLLCYLCPPLDEWPAEECAFHRSLAVPPYDIATVSTRYHERFETLARAHRGITIVDAEADTVTDDGLTHPAPRIQTEEPSAKAIEGFPRAAASFCMTTDQCAAVQTFANLQQPGVAVVEADRGRGKSSAAGIAAACFAAQGDDVLVTAPSPGGVRSLFDMAVEVLSKISGSETPPSPDPGTDPIETDAGGGIRYLRPPVAAQRVGADRPDLLIVDEAAGLPVRLLESLLAVDRVAYVTTIHGYEGAGRSFDVRFRDRLDDVDRPVYRETLETPIRYAGGDPVEVWAFHVLALDANPPADQLVADATPESTEPITVEPEALGTDETRLREVFGTLVLAHYRTEPNDLARLLDAPNVSVHARCHDGHIAAVALLAREGNLPAETRSTMYEGARIAGNMLPDVLTSQLRDETAGEAAGARVLRIATQDGIRSRGIGSALLEDLKTAAPDCDYLGAGFGATPGLVKFWRQNGYRCVHLSTRRNERSGEYSAIMLQPRSPVGRRLVDRHASAFVDRAPAVLSDALDDVDPDVVRAALRAVGTDVNTDLSDRHWRVVTAAAYGPGLYDIDPSPFRALALRHLVEGAVSLDARAERLLVTKVLQARDWESVVGELGYVSRGECMRALGRAYRPLVDAYGGERAAGERERHREDDPEPPEHP